MSRLIYTRGRAVEYMAREYLRGLGYYVVLSTGKYDPIDMVAWRDHAVRFVKVERLNTAGTGASYVAKRFAGDIESLRKMRRPVSSSIHLWTWTFGYGWTFYDVLPGGIMEAETGVVW